MAKESPRQANFLQHTEYCTCRHCLHTFVCHTTTFRGNVIQDTSLRLHSDTTSVVFETSSYPVTIPQLCTVTSIYRWESNLFDGEARRDLSVTCSFSITPRLLPADHKTTEEGVASSCRFHHLTRAWRIERREPDGLTVACLDQAAMGRSPHDHTALATASDAGMDESVCLLLDHFLIKEITTASEET